MMNPEQIKQEQERVKALLEGATNPDSWYWQPGWGLQCYFPDGLGLLVPDEQKAGDMLLMEAAPRLARQLLAALDTIAAQQAQAAERERALREALAQLHADMQASMDFLATQERDALNDGMNYDTAARYHAQQSTLAPYVRRIAALAQAGEG